MPRNSTVFFAVLLLPLSIIAGCSRNDGPINNFHPYGIKHAALHLEYFGDTRGTEDLFFDNFGDQETHIKHSETVTDKEFHPKYTVSVRNIANIIAVDSVKMETVRLIDKTFDSLYHLSPGDVPTPEEQFASFFGGRGYIKCGDTLIRVQGLALNAHIWQQGKAPSYLFEFKGLIIGNYNNEEGHLNELRLISIDTISPIDTMRFVAPNGFPLRDMTKPASNLPNEQP